MAEPRRIGLLVNPLAGIGGRLAAKGSDHFADLREAMSMGGVPVAVSRAERALRRFHALASGAVIVTASGIMGADAARAAGVPARTIVEVPAITSSADTRRCAAAFLAEGVDVLMFAGGDGTARDIAAEVGEGLALIGIPTGVKMHSGVFALTPEAAGAAAAAPGAGYRMVEIMDADEAARRKGESDVRLFGYAKSPDEPRLMQSPKGMRSGGDLAPIFALGRVLARTLSGKGVVVFGPGSTVREVQRGFGLQGSLLGVDVLIDGTEFVVDVDAERLECIAAQRQDMVIMTGVIGRQGFIFGRGNQQISPSVLWRCGRESLLIVATAEKLAALPSGALHVDTGDCELDLALSGYARVLTGPGEATMMRVRGHV